MKKIVVCLAVSFANAGFCSPAISLSHPDSVKMHQVSSVQFFTVELITASMGGFLGLTLSSGVILRLSDSKFNFVDGSNVNLEHSVFFAAAISGYVTGAAFGTFIVTKHSVPHTSYLKHFLYGMSCAVVGTVLIHTRTEPVITFSALVLGTGMVTFGPIIVPSVYGWIKKFEYERVALSYQPLWYDKQLVHGIRLSVFL
jgi:hypothetical protein